MTRLDIIKPLLATAAGLTKQQTDTMADGDWRMLRDRLEAADPPDSELRACLAFAQAMHAHHRRMHRFWANSYEWRNSDAKNSLRLESDKRKELETQLAGYRFRTEAGCATQAVQEQALIREGVESPGEVLAYAAAKATAETAMQEINRRYVPPDIAACVERVRKMAAGHQSDFEAYVDTIFEKIGEANKVPPGMVNNAYPDMQVTVDPRVIVPDPTVTCLNLHCGRPNCSTCISRNGG